MLSSWGGASELSTSKHERTRRRCPRLYQAEGEAGGGLLAFEGGETGVSDLQECGGASAGGVEDETSALRREREPKSGMATAEKAARLTAARRVRRRLLIMG